MPTPVSMFRSADGKLFDKMADAVAHEQSVFLRDSLRPLLLRLMTGVSALAPDSGTDPETLSDLAVEVVANDKPLAADLQKAFAKLQVTPSTPVARKRAKPAAKPKAAPAGDVPPPPAPTSTDPTPEHLAGIDKLAEGGPINLPSDDQAPPPPSP